MCTIVAAACTHTPFCVRAVPLVADSDWDLEDAETDTTETAEGGAETSVFNEDEVIIRFLNNFWNFYVKRYNR
jgi:hypothetical protein